MGKKPQVKNPLFEVRPSKNLQTWTVLYISQNSRCIPIHEFASEKAALDWINYESKAWLKVYKSSRSG